MALLIAGCGSSIPPPDRVAELDGHPLSYLAFEEFVRRNSVAGAGVLASDVLSSLFDQFLDERLLARLATDRLDLPGELDSREAAQALLESARQEPDEASIAEYYRRNLLRFDRPARVYLRQLLFSDRHQAEQIRDAWSGGASYGGILEDIAGDPGAHAGEEGEFSHPELPPVFAEVLFALAEGEVSEVMPVDYGFHVFQVVRHLAAGVAPLDSVSDEIRRELVARQRASALVELVAEARGRYNVRVFERNLPFNYLGQYGSNKPHESS